MSRRRRIYEGKAKILFEGPEPGTIVQYFKDDATAFNDQKKGTITGKGVLNNRISEYLMTQLGEIGVPTHFIRRLNMREQLVRQVEIIPLEVVVRNVAAGSFAKRFGIEEGTQLPRSIIEFYLQERRARRSAGDRRAHHRFRLGHAAGPRRHRGPDAARQRFPVRPVPRRRHQAGRLQDRVRPALGRRHVRIVLADEISPDSCRLWDLRTNEKMDKDRFRRDLGGSRKPIRKWRGGSASSSTRGRATCAAPRPCSEVEAT